ncbi:hypothetical protein Avbf_10220, partial [Armadillidium vulgare]
FIIIKLAKEISLAEEDEEFSGVKLVEGNSSVCRELPFKQLDEFSLCSFCPSMEQLLLIQENPKENLWMKICLYKEAHNSDVYLRINYRGPGNCQ